MKPPVTPDRLVEETLQALRARRRIPRATYRLQLSADFTFRDAQAIVPYLHELGISDLYTSPIFQARPGSTHGYDICDYGQLNPALGTQADFDALAVALNEHGMGLILDMVPNHMGIGAVCNTWWMDVLENGPSSPYSRYFDIDWHPVKRELANKVLLPILEDQYGVVLEDGKLQLRYEDGRFAVGYYDSTLPVTPDTYGLILSRAADPLSAELGQDDERVQEMHSILTALHYLPSYTETAPQRIAERQREKEIVKRRIAALVKGSPEVGAAIERAVEQVNGTPGEPQSFDALDELLREQPYRLSFWRVASDEINYRRFFEINDMAAVRVELPEVFEAVHRRLLELLASGQATGVRIDHPDGLWDPAAYFAQLQRAYVAEVARQQAGAGDAAGGMARVGDEALTALASGALPLYVVAEKILTEQEPLPEDWAVYGTTGYDFLAAANGLFVERQNEERFTQIYASFIGQLFDVDALVYDAKQLVMSSALLSELWAISYQLDRITEASRRYRDFTLTGLRLAIQEVTASLPVYRTYITGPEGISERDQYFILRAVVDARRRNPGTSRLVFSFLRDTLLLRGLENFAPGMRSRLQSFVMNWQQFTGPVMAKSVEDTAFYVYNRLVSLNEVGGHPDQFGTAVEAFHEQNRARAERWPHAMLATSTHDTKRSEDVRARISVLSELPEAWEAAVARWAEFNAGKKQTVEDLPAPDRNDEYLFYQTLVGVWPDGAAAADEALVERLQDYALKAANEAKVHTSWINPDEAYSEALQSFVAQALEDPAFIADFLPLQRQVAHFGRFNSLAQTLLKLTAPGVPDLYQGTELWDLSLVDPDNRRPVDYERRRAHLSALREHGGDRLALARELVETCADGRIKLAVIGWTLAYRRDNAELFGEGSYEPLEATGERARHVVAYARRAGQREIVVVVPRLVAALTGREMRPPLGPEVWGDTALHPLPPGVKRAYRNVFTGETLRAGDLRLADVLKDFPVALLERV